MIVPVFHNQPLLSLLAVSTFSEDMREAEFCASWLLATAGKDAQERMEMGAFRKLADAAAAFAPLHREWKKRKKAGQIAGSVTHALWCLREDDPGNASMERAIQTADNVGLSRSSVRRALKQFRRVAHFWAAARDCGWPMSWYELQEFGVKSEDILAAVAVYRRGDDQDVFHLPVSLSGQVIRNFAIPLELVPQRGQPGRPLKVLP
jgi:hypothetical protein